MSKWQNRIVGYGEEAPDQLLANPANWRTHPKHQTDALAGVLREVGLVQNVIVNRTSGYVVDGHARIALALRDGQPSVPVTYVELDAAEEALILATLDPISAMAGADAAKLDELLREVSTGEAAVQEMLAGLAEEHGVLPGVEPGAGGDEFDATPDEGPTRCQPGDLWVIGGVHRLICGDSTDAATVARLMGGERAVLCFTDPPYGVDYDETWREVSSRDFGGHHSHKVTNDDRSDWTEAYRLSGSDALYVWHASSFSRGVADSVEAAGYEVRQQIIWVKPFGVMSRSAYNWQHEPCWYAVRRGTSAHWRGDKKQTTVWEATIPNHPMAPDDDMRTPHPTQKPIALAEKAIGNHLDKGEAVYDPFLGSGTTLIAAHRTGRRCYGVELEPRYCDVILRRAEAEGLTVERADG